MLERIVDRDIDLATRKRINEVLVHSVSASTRRSYTSQWSTFEKWAESRGYLAAVPVSPLVVSAYLTERVEGGAKVSSVRAAATAISAMHQHTGIRNPVESAGVKAVIKGISRKYGVAAKQAKPLDKEALSAIEATATLPRIGRGGKLEGKTTAIHRGNVDIALVRVASDAGLRRSEIASLKWGDVEQDSDGTGTVRVKRSKTDQEGEGALLALTAKTMCSLDRIRPSVCVESHSVFGLSAAQIHRRIRDAARVAGLGEGYSGHSGRVGLAVRAARNSAPTAAVMRLGRWQSPGMVARYSRSVAAREDLIWLE